MSDAGSAPPDDADEDLSDYTHIYLDETEEQLDDLVETMLVLEDDPTDEASLNAAFRLLHSIKGAAGMMGFDQITVLTHHLETRFERLRSGRIQLDRKTMNLTLRCIDFLRLCNGRLRDGTELSTPDELLNELRILEEAAEKESEQADAVPVSELVAEATRTTAGDPVAPSEPTSKIDSPDQQASESSQPLTINSLPELGTDHHVVIEFAESTMLKDLKAGSIATQLGNLGDIKATRPDLDELATTEFNTFDVIVNSPLPPETILDQIHREGVQRMEVRVPRQPDAEPLSVWQAPSRTETSTTEPPAAPTKDETPPPVEAKHQDSDTETDADNTSTSSSSPSPTKVVETMRVDIQRLDHLMNLAGELVVNRAQFLQVSNELAPGLRASNQSNPCREFCETLAHTLDRLKSQSTPDAEPLIDPMIIRELEAGIQWVQDQTQAWERGRQYFGHLDEAIDQLSRVSDSIQRGVLGTRMVPIGPLLNRFKRVVRDLAMDRDKDVQLVIDGETTELDKRMIDALGDPMVHLVRNSIDHGLESAQIRREAGKSAVGTITLSARHSGNHVSITVQDDGAGIDPAKIRDSLVRKAIMTPAEAAALPDNEAVNAIFHPGFSTASTVTDISGRGVGMDIVKASIEGLSGTIEIDTNIGQGTTFTLKLPLTLAIIGSLLVRIRGNTFAIPKDDVREIVSIDAADIFDVQGKRTFEVRGVFIPLVSIDELFHWNDHSAAVPLTEVDADPDAITTPNSSTEIAILQSGDRPMGLRVDQSIGSLDVVIKSLADNFTNLPGLAGASILGDGSVALMLDVAALHKMAV